MSRHAYQMPFSPGGEFVWNRKLAHDGAETQIGQPVDKTKFTPLRLRQMYESRMIVPAPFGEAHPPRYLENGRGKADRLRAEIEREEAEQNSAKGQGNAQPRSNAGAAKAVRANAKKPAAAAPPAPAKTVAKPKRNGSAGRSKRAA